MRKRKLPGYSRTQGRWIRWSKRLASPFSDSQISALLPEMRKTMKAAGFWKGAK